MQSDIEFTKRLMREARLVLVERKVQESVNKLVNWFNKRRTTYD